MNIWKQVDLQKRGLPIGRYSTNAAGVAEAVAVRYEGGAAPWADVAAVCASTTGRGVKGEL